MILLGDRCGEDAGNAGIHRVAALLQDADSGFHLHAVTGTGHFARAADGWEHGCRLRGYGDCENETKLHIGIAPFRWECR